MPLVNVFGNLKRIFMQGSSWLNSFVQDMRSTRTKCMKMTYLSTVTTNMVESMLKIQMNYIKVKEPSNMSFVNGEIKVSGGF